MHRTVFENVRSMAGAVAFVLLFQTCAYATYYIPSESMVPTLQVGDRLTTAKFAYGYSRFLLPYDLSLPASLKGRLFAATPARGDVIVFAHPKSGVRMIKRLVGLPGDRIAVTGGRLMINGQVAPRQFVRTYSYREFQGHVVTVSEYLETLPGGHVHAIIERAGRRFNPDMAAVTVPPDSYFMMGDNRDNSADSRFASMGVVPADNLIGRADAILFSLYRCTPETGVECAHKRFAERIR
jgi:signal peptidase I